MIPYFPKNVRIRMTYVSITAAYERMEKTLLELARHPTATDEQVLEARGMYHTTAQQLQELKSKLIQKGYLRGR